MRAAKLLWLGVLALAPQPIPAQQQQPTDPAGEAASAPTQGSLELALQAWVASRAPPTGPPVCRLRHSAEKGGGQCWDGEAPSQAKHCAVFVCVRRRLPPPARRRRHHHQAR